MKYNYKIGDKVKMTRSAAGWILEHPESWQCPRTGELEGFDACAIDAMLTLMGEPPVGTIKNVGIENAFKVKYSKAHESYYEADIDFYPASKVELELDIHLETLKLLQKIAKTAGVDLSTALTVLIAHKLVVEGA